MKRIMQTWLTTVIAFLTSTVVQAQILDMPKEINVEAAPFTGDQINLIIMMLCVSGTALILLLILTIVQKNKKK